MGAATIGRSSSTLELEEKTMGGGTGPVQTPDPESLPKRYVYIYICMYTYIHIHVYT